MRRNLLKPDDTVSFPPSPSPPCHDFGGCLQPSNSNSRSGFEANAAAILIILLCGIICALALNTAIRFFLRRHGAERDPLEIQPQAEEEVEDETTKSTLVDKMKMAPAMMFTAEMKSKLASAEAECAICLTEFLEGEEVCVLAICKHGFHVECIQTWLILHSSCPTCRRSYLHLEHGDDSGGGDT